ncbi:hypothetical protein RI367_006582 [Sorochytrium milnesiophthora]
MYNVTEPTVIDEELLLRAVNEQATGDAADVARKEGIDYRELIVYADILKIDNLWQFENLTKLQLDNNIIEKIENIDHLRNLTWLDLSFNNISVIEGLEKLVKLTDVSLFNNRISKIENMDQLVNLNVLSIGNNNIQDIENLAYLSRFENLRLLNISGNPLCNNAEYQYYVLAHLHHLQYLDYRLVEPNTINIAREKHISEIIAFEEEQKIVNKQKEEQRRKEQLEALYKVHSRLSMAPWATALKHATVQEAHIPGVDNLFDSLFAADQDHEKLRLLCGDILSEVHQEFKAKCLEAIEELKTFVLKHHTVRIEELEQYRMCIRDVKQQTDAEAKQHLDAFQHERKVLVKVINSAHNPQDAEPAAQRLRELIRELSDTLIGQELIQMEQFEVQLATALSALRTNMRYAKDVVKEFERNYTDLSASIVEFCTQIFARLREYENEHHEHSTEVVMSVYEKLSKSDMEDLVDEVRDMLRDKDIITSHLTGSHDYHLAKFDTLEETLNQGLARTTEITTQQVHDEEIKRSRDRVKEIVVFTESCLTELSVALENSAA